ncbi:hypothetical protein BGZ73_007132 [Actinomortierella ambigua]|nr:hypothetical protein BGZ73_007132 [Actinomortierella ambigua]
MQLHACHNCRKVAECNVCPHCTIDTVVYCSEECRLLHARVHQPVCRVDPDNFPEDIEPSKLAICVGSMLAPVALEACELLFNSITLMLLEYSREPFTPEDAISPNGRELFSDIECWYHPMIEVSLKDFYTVLPDEWLEYRRYFDRLRFKATISHLGFSVAVSSEKTPPPPPPSQKVQRRILQDKKKARSNTLSSPSDSRRLPFKNESVSDAGLVGGGDDDDDEDDLGDYYEEKFQVEEILEHKINSTGYLRYKIKWLGYPAKDSTWQKRRDLISAAEMVREYEANLGARARHGYQAALLLEPLAVQTLDPSLDIRDSVKGSSSDESS